MRWKRALAIAAAAIVAIVACVAIWAWIAKPWQPKIEVSDPGSTGRRIDELGVFANFFPGRGVGPRPAILALGGSEGGLGKGNTNIARTLAARGYAVLQPSYFRGPGQNLKLENIPLETFDRALAWLRTQPGVDADRIAVYGGSKGAEAALLVATRHPELKAVVLAMPSSVVWAGVDWNFGKVGSSWSVGGKPLPWLPLGTFDYKRTQTEGIVAMYRDGLATLPRHPDTVIPVERIGAPILLVCGEADTLWPSCPMARQIEARARRFGHPAVTLLAYRDAGHGVQGLPVPPGDPRRDRIASMGGTPDGNIRARDDNWPKLLAFLAAALQPER